MDFEASLLKKRILIVDDDYSLNTSIKEVLKNAGFQHISCAYSISNSVDLLSMNNIDLIILDIMLPDGEGYSLAKDVRKHSDIPILFLTAKNNPEDEINGLKAGGDDYVTKPFLPQVLIYRIMTLLRRAYKGDTELIELDNCTIHLTNALVQKGNVELSLTPTEIQIIKKLYANKNYIVSTESMCDSVWKGENFGYEKSLMVHIRNIHEKIEDNPSKPQYIVTVKGLGYKFVL